MALLVTGSIGIDTVHTPTRKAEAVQGGSCTYFAAAASYQTPVRVVAAVGGDWPDEHRQVLHGFENICLEGLEVRPESSTFAWGGRYFENMNKRETLFTELGVLGEEAPPIPEKYRDSQFVFLANSHPATQMKLMDQVPDAKMVVADTMDLWINIAHEDLMALLSRLDGLIINDEEAEQLTEINNAISAARKILEFGPSFVVVKKGAHGAILVHKDGVATIPAYPADELHVVDPTGAGDSFAGGFMGHIASVGKTDFQTIQTSMAWGTVTASFTLESFGLEVLSKLDLGQIEARLAEFQAAARVG